ncbi:MAG TPA: pectate lyase, partial [Roseimicrobium sp.]|nr:pectate lyase [Roseimicrobium sp.]
QCWVQPPGTPSVGEAFLDIHAATGDKAFLDAAAKTAKALIRGQRLSGGWYYGIEFDPAKRQREGYRDNPSHRPPKSGRDTANLTMLDDDTSPAALRFLMRYDQATKFQDKAVRECIDYAFKSLFIAQYPCGAWMHNYDRWPVPHDAAALPPLKASYPAQWSRTWGNDWTGRYQNNDNISGHMLRTLLLAHEIYKDERYLAAAKRTGEFFLMAQMPDPQPGWAQQYDARMQPVWERKFEPPAISGRESQDVLENLLLLYRHTRDAKYLEPFPRALAWLKKSKLADGRMARFYELKSNRPLSFVVVGKQYNLTYDFSKSPEHYGFIVDSRIDAIEKEYLRLKSGGTGVAPAMPASADTVRSIIAGMDPRGAWIDKRSMKGHGKASPDGVIQSETFITNVNLLLEALRSSRVTR